MAGSDGSDNGWAGDPSEAESVLREIAEARRRILEQVGRVVVGQREVLDQLLIAVFARGHCLLQGTPGLAKTLMVSTLAQTMDMSFNRIQFTPDLMPSDITGTEVMRHEGEHAGFEFVPGPVFTHFLLADEINRTPPKTQSALLEGMQERQVTAGGQRHVLPEPFFVLATQNPIEQEGTYPLPEAQLDRFLMKVLVAYPDAEEELAIYRLSIGGVKQAVERVVTAEQVVRYQGLVRQVPLSDVLLRYVARLVRATRPSEEQSPSFVKEQVAWGVGPRGGQALVGAAQARAALHGRLEATVEDVRAVVLPTLRHRVVLSIDAMADGQTSDDLLKRLVRALPTVDSKLADNGLVQKLVHD